MEWHGNFVRAQRLTDVKSWCQATGSPYQVLLPRRQVEIPAPRLWGRAQDALPGGAAWLPEVYAATIRQAMVYGGTALVSVAPDLALYDEIALAPRRYGLKGRVLLAADDKKVVLTYNDGKGHIPRAIQLYRDHSVNYFHWLIECLPRLALLTQLPKWANAPLLVEANLPPQCLQALEKVLPPGREILSIASGFACRVDELLVVSDLGISHDNYDYPVTFDEDFVLAPEAVHWLRQQFVAGRPAATHGRKLYLTRRNAGYRRLLNTHEVESTMAALGFEIVDCGRLTFAEQIDLFHGASHIVGPTGATFTNLAFAPPGCRSLVLWLESAQSNYYFWSQLAHLAGGELQFLLGDARQGSARHGMRMHDDFFIDLQALASAVTEMTEL